MATETNAATTFTDKQVNGLLRVLEAATRTPAMHSYMKEKGVLEGYDKLRRMRDRMKAERGEIAQAPPPHRSSIVAARR
jgi:hypothetical protein